MGVSGEPHMYVWWRFLSSLQHGLQQRVRTLRCLPAVGFPLITQRIYRRGWHKEMKGHTIRLTAK